MRRNNRAHTVTGLMSGSSLDGTDLAACRFWTEADRWHFRILAAETEPYPNSLITKIREAPGWKQDRLAALDLEMGNYYAGILNSFHRRNRLSPSLIASHGHTILHRPSEGVTLQAGNGRSMANGTGIPVVNDFRRENVAQGGEGAPLVPAGDKWLFGSYAACINLGGFANISFDGLKGQRLAFDIAPANMALNHLAGERGLNCDRDGMWARRGRVHMRLLDQLNSLAYYLRDPPKSLGREWFMEEFLPAMELPSRTLEDRLATVTEHIAMQVARGIGMVPGMGPGNYPGGDPGKQVLVTGGGALNQFLMERIQYHSRASVRVPERSIVEFKEALVFAFLGLRKVRNEINCLASATGGRKDLSTGVVHYPEKVDQL